MHERYLIYAMPFFLIALLAALPLLRRKSPRRRHVAIAAVVAALPALIPFGTVINGTTGIDSFALHIFGTGRAGSTVPVAHATLTALALSALLAAVYFLAASQQFPPSAAVLITAVAFLGMSTLELGSQLTPPARTIGLPAHADWVDRVVGSSGNVRLVEGRRRDAVALKETAFWNASITRVYSTCVGSFGADFGEQPLSLDRATGDLTDASGAIPARYAVVPASLGVSGRVLARDPAGKLLLVAPAGRTLSVRADRRSTVLCRS
jgi:hypothetical protein